MAPAEKKRVEKTQDVDTQIENLILSNLANPIRKQILEMIAKSPGIVYSRMLKELDIDTGTLNYHLTKLGRLIEKRNGGYYLSDEGKIAIDVMKFIKKKTVLTPANIASKIDSYIILRGIETLYFILKPRKLAKELIEKGPSNYLPIGVLIYLSVLLLSQLQNFNLYSLASNIALLLFFSFVMSRSAHAIWHFQKSSKDMLVLVMISYIAYLVENILRVIMVYTPLSVFLNPVVDYLYQRLIYGIPSIYIIRIAISIFFFGWFVFLLYNLTKEYYKLTRIQTLLLLFISWIFTLIVMTLIGFVMVIIFYPSFLEQAISWPA